MVLSVSAQIVAHLADAELAMGWRLPNMLASPGVALTWDEATWAERWVTRSKIARGLSGTAREQPPTVGVGPARTVGGVL